MTMRMRLMAVGCVAATTLATAGASAQSFTSLSDRVAALEVRLQQKQGQQSIEQLNRIAQLESDLKALRSLVEQLQNDNEQLKQRNREQYIDLDSRLARLEGGAVASTKPADMPARPPVIARSTAAVRTPPAAATRVGVVAAPNAQPATALAVPGDAVHSASEQAAYDAALAAVRADQYADSAQRFNAFVHQYPDSSLAANAYYWMGESYYVTQNYALALEAFKTVVTRYSSSQKTPGALLKLGYSQDGLKQHAAAEATLRDVIQRYPNSDAAEQAQSRLRAMSMDAGH